MKITKFMKDYLRHFLIIFKHFLIVIPVKTGIHEMQAIDWTPAFAGVTKVRGDLG